MLGYQGCKQCGSHETKTATTSSSVSLGPMLQHGLARSVLTCGGVGGGKRGPSGKTPCPTQTTQPSLNHNPSPQPPAPKPKAGKGKPPAKK